MRELDLFGTKAPGVTTTAVWVFLHSLDVLNLGEQEVSVVGSGTSANAITSKGPVTACAIFTPWIFAIFSAAVLAVPGASYIRM